MSTNQEHPGYKRSYVGESEAPVQAATRYCMAGNIDMEFNLTH